MSEEKKINNGNEVEADSQVSQETDPLKKQPSHYKRPTIFYSRIWTLAASAIILFSPIIIALYYQAGPNWAAVVGGLLAVVPIYWPVTIIEQFTYTPLLGPSATMLSLVTGNLTNMKIPAALSALEKFKAKPGSETGKIICLLACSTCALVAIIVCCAGVAGLSVMKPVLDNPVLAPAFTNLLPALFGALGVTFLKKDWKIAILPCAVMIFLFVCFPFLSKFGGLLVPVAIVISVANARIMFKQGLLDKDKDKEKNKIDIWDKFTAFCKKHKKMIRSTVIPVASVLIAGIIIVSLAGQFTSRPFAAHENAKPVTIQKYLSEVWYDKDYNYNIDAAQDFIRGSYPKEVTKSNARCLSATNNGIFGHNNDWVINKVDEYVVHVEGNESRYGSVGVATSPLSTYDDLPTIEPNTFNQDAIDSIPLCLVDGMNEKGVYCAMNRTSNYANLNSAYGVQTNPGSPEIYVDCIPRFILDNCKTADEALILLRQYNIVSNEEKIHFMIGDANRYYIVEVSTGKVTILIDNVLSNFDLSETNIEPYSPGYERYNIALDNVFDVKTPADMLSLLRKCEYSKVFSRDNNPVWYSDIYDVAICNGDLDVNNNMSQEELYAFLDNYIDNHNLTYRGYAPEGAELGTLHSSVYDSKTKRMYLVNQEGLVVYEFSLTDMIDDGTGTVDMFSSIGS